MLNFNQLRTFYYAAKNLNFTVAASELFITQPAVTAQVKSFEEFCSLKLFKKKGRKLHLTDEGKALFDYAENIFKYEKEILNVIDDMKELKRGDLRLGTTKTYARYFMPFLISGFRKAYPHIKIHLDEGSSRDMIYSIHRSSACDKKACVISAAGTRAIYYERRWLRHSETGGDVVRPRKL
jgi:DNA-binding transcriptional LysR family regulator